MRTIFAVLFSLALAFAAPAQTLTLLGVGPGAGGAAPVAPSFVHTDNDDQPTCSYTCTSSSMSIGTAATGRMVVVVGSVVSNALNGSQVGRITGMTIGGGAATIVANTNGSDRRCAAVIGYRVIDAGTTATVALSGSGFVGGAHFETYAVYDIGSTTPVDTDISLNTSSTGGSISLTNSAGDIAIASAIVLQNSGSGGTNLSGIGDLANGVDDNGFGTFWRWRRGAEITSGATLSITNPNGGICNGIVGAVWQ